MTCPRSLRSGSYDGSFTAGPWRACTNPVPLTSSIPSQACYVRSVVMCADEAKRRQSGWPQPKGEHCLSSLRFRAQFASPASGVQWTLPESCHRPWCAGTQFHDFRLPVLCTGTPREPIPGACRPRRSLHVRVEHTVSGWKQRAGYRPDRYTLVARPACRFLSRAAARPTLGGRRFGSGIIERASARLLSCCLTRAMHSHLLFTYRVVPAAPRPFPQNSPIRLVQPGTEQVPFEVTLTHFRACPVARLQYAMLLWDNPTGGGV